MEVKALRTRRNRVLQVLRRNRPGGLFDNLLWIAVVGAAIVAFGLWIMSAFLPTLQDTLLNWLR